MGSSTQSGRVPFAIPGIFWGDICRPDDSWPEWVKRLANPDECMPENFRTPGAWHDEFYESDDFGNGIIPLGHGWHYEDCDVIYDDVYLGRIQHKDGDEVYEINEDQCSAGGGYTLTIVALERNSLEHFAKDFGLNISDIEENVKVFQTL